MEIVEPVALARIPRQLHENSHTRFAPVHGLSAGQKRKRHELCVAVDGDSISVYDIQNGNILSSYAVPPTSSFLCPPCSLRIKSEKGTYSRYTYCATRRSSPRIECFIERFGHGRSLGVSVVANPLDDTDSPLIYLDTIPSNVAPLRTSYDHTVIAVHKNGRVRRFSEGLETEESIARMDDADASSIVVLAAHWSTFDDAQHSILKHRPDIISSVGSNSTFLILLYYALSDSAAVPKVGIWSIYSGLRPIFGLSNDHAKPLVIHDLPEAKIWYPQAELDCSFAPRALALSISSAKGIAIYDLACLVPSITWELSSEPQKLFSATRLTTSFVAGATQASLTVYDTKYNSIRASLDLTRVGMKRKRKTPDTPMRGPLKIISYFPQLGRILAMRRNFLLAFDLKGIDSKIGAKSLLIDSIGRGVSNDSRSQSCSGQLGLSFGKVDDLEASSADLDALRRQMREMAQSGDAEGFQSLFEKVVGDLKTEMTTFPGKNCASHTLPTSKVPYTSVHYILSILFRYVAPEFGETNSDSRSTGSLELALAVHKVLSWLIRSQFLTQEAVLRALSSTSQPSGILEYDDGILARALMNLDSSFGLLSNYIINNTSLEANELAAIVKMVLKVAVAETEEPDTKQTLQLEGVDATDDDLTDGLKDATGSTSQLQVPSQKPDDHRLSLTSVMRALVLALEKWAVYRPSTISRQMRSVLGQAEILALIQFLRQQLYQAGHTKSISQEPYPSPPALTGYSEDNHTSDVQRPKLSLDSTLILLLGCVDAIGPLGFFVNGVERDFMTSLIPDLKSEISLALEGMEEASYLRGVLRETMRYAESAKKGVSGNNANPLTGRGNLAVQGPGTIATLYSEPNAEQGDVEDSIGMLPLSLRAENVVSRIKMRKGGGQVRARSIREMRELENRNKGKYSLERLVL